MSLISFTINTLIACIYKIISMSTDWSSGLLILLSDLSYISKVFSFNKSSSAMFYISVVDWVIYYSPPITTFIRFFNLLGSISKKTDPNKMLAFYELFF